jgi:hypothetical protein
MKQFFTLLFFFLITNACFCQDTLIMKSGSHIPVKVLEVGVSEIKFKKIDNQEGPTYTILKSDVVSIQYKNGTLDDFKTVVEPTPVQTPVPAQVPKPTLTGKPGDICLQARRDAYINYTGRNSGAGWVQAVAILTSPLFALIPAVACSAKPPLDKNLNYKDSELMKDSKYNVCYREAAYKTKKKKIWRNFAIGSGIWLAVVLIANI